MHWILGLIAAVCLIVIIVDAFKNSIVKGLISLFCGIYAIYYGIVEFEHEYKWPIVIGAIICALGGGVLRFVF